MLFCSGHYNDVYRRSCDVGFRRSCIHGVIKCFVESVFLSFRIIISCVFAQSVELNVSVCKNMFISLLEMNKVYDLVGQPSYLLFVLL